MKSEEIAKLAGVSRSTVSRVINNYSNVPEETYKKVMEVINKYNYEPNTSARVLAGKSANTIGLFVVSTSEKDNPNRIYGNNYFAPFVDAVLDAANRTGFFVLVHIIYTAADYSKVRQLFLQKRIDGGIVLGTQRGSSLIPDVIKIGYPLAVIDYDVQELVDKGMNHDKLTIINSQDYEGTAGVVNYLADAGHTKIGIITGRMNTYSGRQRFESFMHTMKARGLDVAKKHVLHGGFLKNVAYNKVKQLISSKELPSAIFSSNDDMAVAAINAFMEEGISIPGDVSIIGFDDVPAASYITPALTTVRVPVYDMAEKAVESLVGNIKKESAGFGTFDYETKLVIRNTCSGIDSTYLYKL